MTYKKIVSNILQMESRQWVETLMKENGIEFEYIWVGDITMNNDKDYDSIMWQVEVIIYTDKHIRNTVVVGGTADDLTGICKSAIWGDGSKLLWLSVPETREQLGITKFKIA